MTSYRFGYVKRVAHLPMQNVAKIRSRMSSVLVLPVTSPRQSKLLRSCWETISSGSDVA